MTRSELRLTASLVLFHNDPDLYGQAMQSFLDGTASGILYVIDNSAEPLRHSLFEHPRVRYRFLDRNVGFGAGHNLAIREAVSGSDLHLLLNPDISFGPDVLPALVKRMGDSVDVAALMPRIQYPDGSLQRLCKLLPTPVDLIFRRFVPFPAMRERINQRYELHSLPQTGCIEVPSLSGCFLLIRTTWLAKSEGFDERYFMYMEDVDLVRRLGDHGRTLYDPSVSVTHAYAKGSYRNRKLLTHHLRSAVAYFFKWGWLIDPVRSERNRQILKRLNRS